MTRKRVLFVDDNKEVLKLLKLQVKDYFGKDYQCDVCESAEDALELIDELIQQKGDIVLIVTDWLMPGIKGDEFLVKVHQKYPKIKSILLTGQADEDAIERAKKEANLTGFIYKPWSKEELIDLIAKVLNHEK